MIKTVKELFSTDSRKVIQGNLGDRGEKLKKNWTQNWRGLEPGDDIRKALNFSFSS